MRKFLVLLGLTLTVLLTFSQSVFAQISSYDSAFQVQNLSGSVATIAISFYAQDGSLTAQVPDTIAANGSNTYAPLPSQVPNGFNGSVVISSDQPVAAIANVIGDGTQGSSYSSFDGGSTSVSLPLVNKDFYGIDTWFNVQNAGTTATTVTVSYSSQPSCNELATIQPGAAATFDQATNTCLPSGYIGAATATTDQPDDAIVATALQVASSGLFAYNGFTSGSTNPVLPLISNNVYGIHSGVQIQNQGGTNTNVTVTYTPAGAGNGTTCTETRTITAGSSKTFSINVFSFGPDTSGVTTDCVFGQYFNGSAQVTANSASQPLVAVVNQTSFASNSGSSYNGFDPASATDTVVMPLLMEAYDIWTGFNIVNVGSSATVTCTYSGLSSTYNVVTTLGAGKALSVQNVNSGFPANTGGGYVGSGTCTAAAGGMLLGVVNQANTNSSGDGTLTYEAFNQ